MSEKVSGILSSALLESASILHQGRKIRNSFAYKGFMDPPTSMITTTKMMRQNSRELYNMLYQTCADKLRMNILSLTMYTQLDYIKKYCVFVKLFCMSMNKPMNAYHPLLYVIDSTSYENPFTYN